MRAFYLSYHRYFVLSIVIGLLFPCYNCDSLGFNSSVKEQLSQFKADILREKGKKNLKTNTGGGHMGLSTIDKGINKHNTQKEIAKDLNWSTGKVAMAD